MIKKGFTLIELLAVIIILAIVALIATPIILNVIDDARVSAGRSEANMILSGINNYCASEDMKYQLDNSYERICTSSMNKEDVPTMVTWATIPFRIRTASAQIPFKLRFI